jgi:pilus assembly protein CpaC
VTPDILARRPATMAAASFPVRPLLLAGMAALCLALAPAEAAGQAAAPLPLVPGAPAAPQVTGPAATAAANEITVETGEGRTVRLPSPAATLFVADPETADVQAPQDGRSFFLFGRKPGRTSVFALGADGRPLSSWSVQVTQRLSDLGARLASVPGLAAAVESTPGGLVVTGTADTPTAAHQAISLARQFAGEDRPVLDRIAVNAPSQVNLRVRVAEVSRNVTKELGVNLESLFNVGSFTFGIATGRDAINTAGQILRSVTGAATLPFGYQSDGVDVNGVVDALAEDGLVSILAEPNLTALSGETASFLAGGEFPIPVSKDDDELTIEFKQFGVSLDFTPTVLSPGRISMRVRPEVSELTDEGAVIVDGLRIPALSVRRAETTVELASGQSFAIAGLLQNKSRSGVEKVPAIGEVPVLGALFRSTRFLRGETELVIVVTPYLVRPVSDPAALSAPTDGYVPATDIERVLLGRLDHLGGAAPVGPGAERLSGDAGFILE